MFQKISKLPLILSVAIIINTISVTAFMTPSENYNLNRNPVNLYSNISHTNKNAYFYKNLKSDNQRRLYQQLALNVKLSSGGFSQNKAFEVKFPYKTVPTQQDVSDFMNDIDVNFVKGSFLRDFPQLYWIDYNKIEAKISSKGHDIIVEISPSNSSYFSKDFNSHNDIIKSENDLNKYVSDIVRTFPKDDKYQQLIYINDWLIENNTFSHTASHDLLATLKGKNSKPSSSYDYSTAFKLLSNAIDIPVILVDGTTYIDNETHSHTYNYVELNDKVYGVDVANNDNKVAGSYEDSENHLRFFLVGSDTQVVPNSTKNTFTDTHKNNTELNYPKLNKNRFDYSPYYVAEAVVKGERQYFNSLQEAVKESDNSHTIRLLQDIDLKQVVLINKNTSIDLNGYNITTKKKLQSLFIVNKNNTLVISSNRKSGKIEQPNSDCHIASNLGTIIIRSGIFEQESASSINDMFLTNAPTIHTYSVMLHNKDDDKDTVVVKEVAEPIVKTPVINVKENDISGTDVKDLTTYINNTNKPVVEFKYKGTDENVDTKLIPSYTFKTDESGTLVSNKEYIYTAKVFGRNIRVKVIYTKNNNPLTGSVTIAGTGEYDTVLTATAKTNVDEEKDIQYDWYVDNKLVSSGTNKNTYTVKKEYIGKEIYVSVKSTKYTSILESNRITGKKYTPKVTTLPTAQPIQYGKKLNQVQLQNGSMDNGKITGTFSFENGAVQPDVTENKQKFSVIFTPSDTSIYNNVTMEVEVTVTKADLTVSLPMSTPINYGQTLKDSMLNYGSVVNPNNSDKVSGHFVWVDENIKPTESKDHKIKFIPNDTDRYNEPKEEEITVNINDTLPEINLILSKNEQIIGQKVEADIYIYNPYDEKDTDLPKITLTANGENITLIKTDQNNYFKASIEIKGNIGDYVTVKTVSEAEQGKYLSFTEEKTVLIQDSTKTKVDVTMVNNLTYGESLDIKANVFSMLDKTNILTGKVEFLVDGVLVDTKSVVDTVAETTIPYDKLGNAGIKKITVKFKADSTMYYSAETIKELTINKKQLAVVGVPDVNNIIQGSPMPNITLKYNGFIGNDNETSITNPPTYYFTDSHGTVISNSNVIGRYNINLKVSENNSNNYTLVPYVSKLFVNKKVLPVDPIPENGFIQENQIIHNKDEVEINVEDQTKITEDLMDNILEQNKVKDVVIKNKEVQIVFPKNSMNSVDNKIVYDFGMNVVKDNKEDEIIKEVPKKVLKEAKVAIAVKYNYSGPLPGEATISIKVGEEFKNKELYYYYHNDVTNEFELKQSAIVNDEGVFTIQQNHFSNYLISDVFIGTNKNSGFNKPLVINNTTDINDRLFLDNNNVVKEYINKIPNNNDQLGPKSTVSSFGNILNVFPGLDSVELPIKNMILIGIIVGMSFIGTFMIYKQKYEHIDN